jgi:hypothetical protein
MNVTAKTDTTSRTGSRQNENSAAQAPRDRHAYDTMLKTYSWPVPGNARFSLDDGAGATDGYFVMRIGDPDRNLSVLASAKRS